MTGLPAAELAAPVAFAAAALGHGAALVWLRRALGDPGAGRLLPAAIGVTLLWALTGLLVAPGAPALETMNALRLGAWLLLLERLLRRPLLPGSPLAQRATFLLRCGLAATTLAAAAPLAGRALGTAPAAVAGDVGVLVMAVVGLALAETLARAADEGTRWAIKLLLVATGGLFTFEIFRCAEALLLGGLVEATRVAQPLVAALVLPPVAIAATRLRRFAARFQLDRSVVLGTSVLLAAGAYLLAVALAGWLLREVGLGWGPALQITFFLGAALVLVVALTSGGLEARGRRLLGRQLFSFAYDYRREWQRFVATMDWTAGPLAVRAVRALADPLECTGGALFLRGRDNAYRLQAAWNWTAAEALPAPPPALVEPLTAERPAAPLDPAAGPAAWPGGLAEAWLLVGLHAQGRRLGVVLLGKPRVRRALDREDEALVAVLAAQVAGYLAEEQATRALIEAQRFEQLSKRFSFVAHDLKNLVSQLAGVLALAERHRANPAFVDDALLTIGESVEKMRSLLLRLRDRDEAAARPVDLAPLLADLARRHGPGCPGLTVRPPGRETLVLAERATLTTVLDNVVDNAREAGAATVAVRVDDAPEAVRVAIADDGPGMTEGFLRDHLFQPFVSSKADGFGIGMYQCREWIERWGGTLQVASTPGAGTVVTIALPRAADPAPAAHRLAEAPG